MATRITKKSLIASGWTLEEANDPQLEDDELVNGQWSISLPAPGDSGYLLTFTTKIGTCYTWFVHTLKQAVEDKENLAKTYGYDEGRLS